MPARDVYHDVVKRALEKDGWTITHDPYTIVAGLRHVFVDLGAERMVAAERGNEKIAAEIKVFSGASEVHDLEEAVGQYLMYRALMAREDAERKLYLAVPHIVVEGILSEPIARPVLEDLQVSILVFDPLEEVIIKWIR